VDPRAGVEVLEARVTSHLSGIELWIDQPLALSLRFPYRMSMVQKKMHKQQGQVNRKWEVFAKEFTLPTTIQSPL